LFGFEALQIEASAGRRLPLLTTDGKMAGADWRLWASENAQRDVHAFRASRRPSTICAAISAASRFRLRPAKQRIP
jgi:hypothetical protein